VIVNKDFSADSLSVVQRRIVDKRTGCIDIVHES